jgi:hypothetical protein
MERTAEPQRSRRERGEGEGGRHHESGESCEWDELQGGREGDLAAEGWGRSWVFAAKGRDIRAVLPVFAPKGATEQSPGLAGGLPGVGPVGISYLEEVADGRVSLDAPNSKGRENHGKHGKEIGLGGNPLPFCPFVLMEDRPIRGMGFGCRKDDGLRGNGIPDRCSGKE